MLPRADVITVTPASRVALTPLVEGVGDPRQQAFQRSLAGLVGKSLPAEVLSRLSDGSFLVKVAGNSARMMLPPNAQPGAELPLTLVALSPRPTFQLSSAPQSAAIPAFAYAPPQTALADSAAEAALFAPASPGMARGNAAPAAGAMQQAARLFGTAPPADQLPEADAASTPSTLSATARIISSVLGAALKAEHPQSAIIAPLPLLAAPETDPARLAAALKDGIAASGLFYESHVAEWSAGKRPLAELLREPQMQRAPAAGLGAAASGVTAAAADPATAQFINLQLSSQEQGRVAWQGQLWPGQDLAWQISRDPPEGRARQNAGGEQPEAPWRSTLRLRFPLLGEVAASVILAGDQLQIQLRTESDQIGSLLRAHADRLSGALEASGATLALLTVDTSNEQRNG